MLLETGQNTISGNYQPSDNNAFMTELNSVAFEILSKGIYKNPIHAIVRELCANAHDAHVCANNLVPFYIQAPTGFEPTFRIRDYGTGIPPEQINQIYFSYFSSNKRHTNDLIGGKGLGSKTPLAYTDSYIVNNYYEGAVYRYLIYKDATNCPVYTATAIEASGEPNGLEIIISVKYGDLDKFTRQIKDTATWFNCTSNIDIPQQEWLIKTPYGGILPSHQYNSTKAIVMGNIPYPLSLWNTPYATLRDWLSHSNFYLFANIGDYPVTASRDQIVESDITKKQITTQLRNFLNYIHEAIAEQIKGLPTKQASLKASQLYWHYGLRPPQFFTLDYEDEQAQLTQIAIYQHIRIPLPEDTNIWSYEFTENKKWNYKQKTIKLDTHISYDTHNPPILAHSIYPKKGNPTLVDKVTRKDHIIFFSNDPNQIETFYALVPDTQKLDLSEHFKPIPRIKSTPTPRVRKPATYNTLTAYGIKASDTLDLSEPIWLIKRQGTTFYINGKPYPHTATNLFWAINPFLKGTILIIQKTTPENRIPDAPYLDKPLLEKIQQTVDNLKQLNLDTAFYVKRQLYHTLISRFTNAHKFKALGYSKQLDFNNIDNPIINNLDARALVNWLLNETFGAIEVTDLQAEKLAQQNILQEKFPILKLIDWDQPISSDTLEVINQYI